MDIKQITDLVKLVNKSNIGELSIEQENFKITIKQKEENSSFVTAAPTYLQQAAPAPATGKRVKKSMRRLRNGMLFQTQQQMSRSTKRRVGPEPHGRLRLRPLRSPMQLMKNLMQTCRLRLARPNPRLGSNY